MSESAPAETPRLKLDDLTFRQLCDPKLREQLLKDNKCNMMSQGCDDEGGTVKIIVRSRSVADIMNRPAPQPKSGLERIKQTMRDFWRHRTLARE